MSSQPLLPPSEGTPSDGGHEGATQWWAAVIEGQPCEECKEQPSLNESKEQPSEECSQVIDPPNESQFAIVEADVVQCLHPDAGADYVPMCIPTPVHPDASRLPPVGADYAHQVVDAVAAPISHLRRQAMDNVYSHLAKKFKLTRDDTRQLIREYGLKTIEVAKTHQRATMCGLVKVSPRPVPERIAHSRPLGLNADGTPKSIHVTAKPAHVKAFLKPTPELVRQVDPTGIKITKRKKAPSAGSADLTPPEHGDDDDDDDDDVSEDSSQARFWAMIGGL